MSDTSIFFTRPVSLLMLVLAFLSFFFPLLKQYISISKTGTKQINGFEK